MTTPDLPEDSASEAAETPNEGAAANETDTRASGSNAEGVSPQRPPAGQRGRFVAARPPALAPRAQEEEPVEEEPIQEDYSTLSVAPAERLSEVASVESVYEDEADWHHDAGKDGALEHLEHPYGHDQSDQRPVADSVGVPAADSAARSTEDPAETGHPSNGSADYSAGAYETIDPRESSRREKHSGKQRGTLGEDQSDYQGSRWRNDQTAHTTNSRSDAVSGTGHNSGHSTSHGAAPDSGSAAATAAATHAASATGEDFRRPASEIHLDNEARAFDQYEFGDMSERGHSADPGADPASRQYRPAHTRSRNNSRNKPQEPQKPQGQQSQKHQQAQQQSPSAKQSTATAVTDRPGSTGPAGPTGPTNSTGLTDSSGPESSSKHKPEQDDRPSDAEVVRTGGSMAIATLLSRITGFLRTVLIGSALGAAVASAFNTANTLPNLITELVLGAVLTSLVVPVLVRAEKEDPDRGEAFIRRLLTLTFTLTVGITVVAVLAAPWLIKVTLARDGQVNIQMATAFAYLVLPQIFFYAMFAVFMAVLNTKGVFKPGAWAPVVNNVVTLLVLGGYLLLPEHAKLSASDEVNILDPNILLLGIGTTLGVVFQALIMVPYLRRAGINLKPLWGVDERLKSFAGMGVAIVLYVLISQIGWAVNNKIASGASDAAPTIYMQAWQLLQMPYGVIGVTLLTAVMPRLSRNAADGDDKAVVRDLTVATRLTMIAMIPIIIFMTAFGGILAPALFAYKSFSLEDANVLGWTVSFSAFTLIPYALVLLHLRVFYAREEVWTPTFIIAGITTTKIALISIAPFIATEPRLVVVLLGAANGFGFVAGAIIGVLLLRRSLGNLNSGTVMKTSMWATGASIVGALVAWQIDLLLSKTVFSTQANPWFLIRLIIAGLIFLLVTGLVLSRSKLQEVMTIGAAMSRLPVVGRFITSGRQIDKNVDTGEQPMAPEPIAPAEAAREAAVANSLLPPMPPLSAGRVRGPRLVPGAPVLDGRFRLLADHGGSSASRFWQARNTASGDVVALTILDPLAAVRMGRRPGEFVPNQSRRVMQTKTQMSQRSREMQRIQESIIESGQDLSSELPGMARILQVIDSPGSVVVISEWTIGTALSAVADTQPDPLAAGYAIADLADATAVMHDHQMTLGVDHRDRIRISTSGGAVLAFLGFLPNNSSAQDVHGIAVALELLLRNVPLEDVPPELTDLYMSAKTFGTLDSGAQHPGSNQDELPEQTRDPREMAKQLRYLTAGELDVHADSTPTPKVRQAGFGGRRVRVHNVAGAGVIAIVSAILVAALIGGLVSYFGGNREDSPLSPDSIRSGAQGVINRTPDIVPIQDVEEWKPEHGKGTLDSPDTVKNILDPDPTKVWQSDSYLRPLGRGADATKEGIGILVNLPKSTRINALDMSGLRPGMHVEFRRINDSDDGSDANSSNEGDTESVNPRKVPTGLDQTTLVATMNVESPDMHVGFSGEGDQDFTVGEGLSRYVQMASKHNEENGNANKSDDDVADPTEENSPERDNATTASEQLLIWITGLPEIDGRAQIGGLRLLGTWEGQHQAGKDAGDHTTPARPTEARRD